MESVYQLALHIIHTLFKEGHTAYFAGGWVRDRLHGIPTEDEIDIATSAPPDIVQSLFPKTIPVGIAFGVIIVVLQGINFEVTTFRKDHSYQDGRHPISVDYSTAQKDAERRDFTINGMFFDPIQNKIYDYIEGQKDLEKKIIRTIGDPFCRFEEDRLRMIRAVRFAARFDFEIEAKTQEAIAIQAHLLLPSVSMERIWQEFNKMAIYPRFDKALQIMFKLNLLQTIFPELNKIDSQELNKRIAFFPYAPLHCPTIVYLMELFPEKSYQEKELLCRYLKTKKTDIQITCFFDHASRTLAHSQLEAAEWAHLYAHPLFPLFLQVQSAKLLPPEREQFLQFHDMQQSVLAKHITRIQTHQPVLHAAHLQEKGILSGKTLGLLLKEGEKLSINKDLDDPQIIIKILLSSPLWP